MYDDDDEDGRAPICPYCGVTALASESGDSTFVCENPDCDAYGDSVHADDVDGDSERPSIERGDIVMTDDGRVIGMVLVVADCGGDQPLWELHVDCVVEGLASGVSIYLPSEVHIANSDENRALMEQHDIRLA